MTQADYYQVLGIAPDATVTRIKEAYRQQAFQYHPDRNRGNPSAAEQMKLVNEAYAVLSNPTKKREYDMLRNQFGTSAYSQFRKNYSEQDIFSGSDINHIFEEMARSFGVRGFNEIFKEFYGQQYRQFEFKKSGISGRGHVFGGHFKPGSQPGPQSLPHGSLGKISRFLLEKISGVALPKDGADIHGHLYLDPQLSRNGGPYAYYLRQKSKKLIVKVPPGIREGQIIRLAAMGKEGKDGGRPGDLLLRVHIKTPLLKSIKNILTGHRGRS